MKRERWSTEARSCRGSQHRSGTDGSYISKEQQPWARLFSPPCLGLTVVLASCPAVLLPGELSVPVCPPSDTSFVLRFGNCQCTSPFLNTEDVEIGDEERFSLCSVISSRSPLTVSSWLLTSVPPVVSNSMVMDTLLMLSKVI